MLNGLYFWLGPIMSIKSHVSYTVDIKDSWARQILLRAHTIYKRTFKTWNLHVFEWG